MYAVFKTGGKQYKVQAGDVLRVEKLEVEAGKTVTFGNVLIVGDEKESTIGAPIVEGAGVKAEVVKQTRNDKIVIFKKKRRQGYRRKRGHRQHVTVLKVTEVVAKGAKADV